MLWFLKKIPPDKFFPRSYMDFEQKYQKDPGMNRVKKKVITQLSHKQTSSDPTRRFRQVYDWGNLNECECNPVGRSPHLQEWDDLLLITSFMLSAPESSSSSVNRPALGAPGRPCMQVVVEEDEMERK